jgi:hypothetical protein
MPPLSQTASASADLAQSASRRSGTNRGDGPRDSTRNGSSLLDALASGATHPRTGCARLCPVCAASAESEHCILPFNKSFISCTLVPAGSRYEPRLSHAELTRVASRLQQDTGTAIARRHSCHASGSCRRAGVRENSRHHECRAGVGAIEGRRLHATHQGGAGTQGSPGPASRVSAPLALLRQASSRLS